MGKVFDGYLHHLWYFWDSLLVENEERQSGIINNAGTMGSLRLALVNFW